MSPSSTTSSKTADVSEWERSSFKSVSDDGSSAANASSISRSNNYNVDHESSSLLHRNRASDSSSLLRHFNTIDILDFEEVSSSAATSDFDAAPNSECEQEESTPSSSAAATTDVDPLVENSAAGERRTAVADRTRDDLTEQHLEDVPRLSVFELLTGARQTHYAESSSGTVSPYVEDNRDLIHCVWEHQIGPFPFDHQNRLRSWVDTGDGSKPDVPNEELISKGRRRAGVLIPGHYWGGRWVGALFDESVSSADDAGEGPSNVLPVVPDFAPGRADNDEWDFVQRVEREGGEIEWERVKYQMGMKGLLRLA